MLVIEMRQLIHDMQDTDHIEFGVDGVVYAIDAHIKVNEWNTLYLGVDKEDLTESMIEHELSNSDDIDTDSPADDDEWPEDREAFMQSLAKAEDAAPVGDCCELPKPAREDMWDRKPGEETDTPTDMM